MLEIGANVVYPMHGGAYITGIDIHEHDGEKKKYYILKMLCSDMVVSIPVDNAEKLGLRAIVKTSVINKVAEALKDKPDLNKIKAISWNRRLQFYISRLKTGDIIEVAKIYKTLVCLDVEKRISVGERRLLHTAKNIVESELMLVKNFDEQTAEKWLEKNMK